MNAREEIFNLLRKTLCNETTDCENYPECVNSGDLDGCPPLDLAQVILDAGFVRLEDVEVDKKKVEEKLSGCGISEHYHIPFIAKVIAEAKGILRVKEGK